MKLFAPKKIVLTTVLASLFLLVGCGNSTAKKQSTGKKVETTTIHFSAAASLKEALDEITTQFEKNNPAIKVNLDFAGSGQIREKVISGAPIDGVLLASKSDTDILKEKKKITDETKLLKNTLVVVGNKESHITKEATLSEQLEKSSKIAIGDPESVPAGKYATDSIASLHLTDKLKDRYIIASDVRQVLAYTESGNVDLGYVYQTDALLSKKVEVLQKVPADLHDPILYYTAITRDQKNQKTVRKYNAYLETKKARTIFKKYGFTMATAKENR